jgi:hypothetical protein
MENGVFHENGGRHEFRASATAVAHGAVMDTPCAVVVKGEIVAGQSGPPSPGKAPPYWDEAEWAERQKELRRPVPPWAKNFSAVVSDGEVLMSEDQLMATRRAITQQQQPCRASHQT